MKLRQLSLFLENRPGALRLPCQVLGAAGIDILSLSLADTQQFGILRLIVDRTEQANAVLKGTGFTVARTEVIALEVPRRGSPKKHLGLFDWLEVRKQTPEFQQRFVRPESLEE